MDHPHRPPHFHLCGAQSRYFAQTVRLFSAVVACLARNWSPRQDWAALGCPLTELHTLTANGCRYMSGLHVNARTIDLEGRSKSCSRECFALPRQQTAAYSARAPLPHCYSHCRSRLPPYFVIKSQSSSLLSLSEVLRSESSRAVSATAPATTAHRH
jgi:hypothetical protein